jgi:hypothetical protein
MLLLLVLVIYMGSTAFVPAEQDSPEVIVVSPTPSEVTLTPGAASLVLSPPEAAAGEIITVTGAGFPGNSPITIYLGPPGEGSPAYEYTQTVSDLEGGFVYPFIVPDAWPDGTPIPAGTVVVLASDPFGNASAMADMEYLPAAAVVEGGVDAPVDSGEVLTYTNEILGIAFEYPAEWQNVPGEADRYAGDTGFFAVEPMGAPDAALDVICTALATDAELPFGTAPTIEYITVAAQPACLLLPSADQAPEMNGQAVVVATYPAPITVTTPEEATYGYVAIYGDQGHLTTLFTETLIFLPAE